MVARLVGPCIALVLVLPTTSAGYASDAGSAPCRGTHWLGAWDTAPGSAGPSFSDQTLRLVVTPTVGGRVVRVRLSNRFGSSALRLDKVAIGLRREGAALARGSNRPVTFGGRRPVAIPAGGGVMSDGTPLSFKAFADLAISIYVSEATGPATSHAVSFETSYVTAGDHVGDVTWAGAPAESLPGWPLLDGLDVRASKRTGAVVAFGDSITEGFPGDEGRSRRYPDFLARRLVARRKRLSVLNAGLGGNRILSSAPAELPLFGPSALSRLRNDVPTGAAVTDVIVLEGINDIGRSDATAREVVGGLRRIVRRLHERRLNVLLGTLTPSGGEARPGYGGPAAAATRSAVNRWIRRTGLPDAVVDFDAAVRDPAKPSRLASRYDSGDHLHPSAAGYRRMAAAIKLRDLSGASCEPHRALGAQASWRGPQRASATRPSRKR